MFYDISMLEEEEQDIKELSKEREHDEEDDEKLKVPTYSLSPAILLTNLQIGTLSPLPPGERTSPLSPSFARLTPAGG